MKIKIVILSFLIVGLSCQKQPNFSTIENLNNNTISSFGHAGMGLGHKFPINSMESIYKCLSLRPTGVEIDLQLSKDSIFVAFHDKTLQEMTNLTGEIYQEDWSYIQTGIYNEPPLTEYQIASFEEIITNISNPKNFIYVLDCQIYVDELDEAYANFYVRKLLEIIDQYDLSQNVYIEFAERIMLEKIKTLRPDLKIFIQGGSDFAISVAKELDLYGVVGSNNEFTKERIQEVHEEGLRVALFSLHSSGKNIEAINKHPDFLQSDKIRSLVELLE